MNYLSVNLVTKEEFYEILMDYLVKFYGDETVPTRELLSGFLESGFPKLDYQCLDHTLSKLFVLLPPMFVDIGDRQFYYFVNGHRAMTVPISEFYTSIDHDHTKTQ